MSVIVANDVVAAPAAKAVTSTIPIVFQSGIDPVKVFLVASLNHPGTNLTGVSMFVARLGAKRLETWGLAYAARCDRQRDEAIAQIIATIDVMSAKIGLLLG